MIVVNGVIHMSQQSIAAMKSAVAQMEQASRAEAGCEDYTFSEELNNPGVIRITERWKSMDDLLAHFEMPHMADFQKAMGDNPPDKIDVNFYEAHEVEVPGM